MDVQDCVGVSCSSVFIHLHLISDWLYTHYNYPTLFDTSLLIMQHKGLMENWPDSFLGFTGYVGFFCLFALLHSSHYLILDWSTLALQLCSQVVSACMYLTTTTIAFLSWVMWVPVPLGGILTTQGTRLELPMNIIKKVYKTSVCNCFHSKTVATISTSVHWSLSSTLRLLSRFPSCK